MRRAGITLVNAHADWFWLVQEFYIWEAWQQVHFVSTAMCVVSTCKCCGTAGSTIKVHYQSNCSRVYFILLILVMRCIVRDSCTFYVGCNRKPRMILEQKFSVFLLMPNMIFTGLCCNTKHISASQYSCRDSITCSEKTLFQFKNIEKAESLIKLQKKKN